ncbi:MAG TPA: LysR substrate-binding domain-containing protein [Aestuariivirgaceae bacterium]|jgi:aminoethylphosphonate catabolism LysR family transcriptional regulator
MSYAQLKAFHAVAASGGFSKAAHKLNVTQPALSDHVRKLESAYGVELFSRTRRKVDLTDLGRQLFALTERQFEAEAQAIELLSRAQGLRQGLISIGADAAVHALPLIKRFNERYPRVELKLITGNTVRLINQLEKLEIDFAVVAEVPSSEIFFACKVREDPLVCILAQNHPLSRRKKLLFDDLLQTALVLRERGSVTRALFEGEASRRGARPRQVIEIEGREAANEAVAQGLGAGIVSRGELPHDERLRAIAVADWRETMQEWLVCLKARADLHIMRAFLQLLAS